MHEWVFVVFLIVVVVLVVVKTYKTREGFVSFRQTIEKQYVSPLKIYFTDETEKCDAGFYKRPFALFESKDPNDIKIMKDLHGNCSYTVPNWFMFPKEDLSTAKITPKTKLQYGDPSKWFLTYSSNVATTTGHPILDNTTIKKHADHNIHVTTVKYMDMDEVKKAVCVAPPSENNPNINTGIFMVIPHTQKPYFTKNGKIYTLTSSERIAFFSKCFMETTITNASTEMLEWEPVMADYNINIYMKNLCGVRTDPLIVPAKFKFTSGITNISNTSLEDAYLQGTLTQLKAREARYANEIILLNSGLNRIIDEKDMSIRALEEWTQKMRMLIIHLLERNPQSAMLVAFWNMVSGIRNDKHDKLQYVYQRTRDEFTRSVEKRKIQHQKIVEKIASVEKTIDIAIQSKLDTREFVIEGSASRYRSMNDFYSIDDVDANGRSIPTHMNIYMRIM